MIFKPEFAAFWALVKSQMSNQGTHVIQREDLRILNLFGTRGFATPTYFSTRGFVNLNHFSKKQTKIV